MGLFTCMYPTRDQAHTCLRYQHPFSAQDDTQPTEPHQPRQSYILICLLLILCKSLFSYIYSYRISFEFLFSRFKFSGEILYMLIYFLYVFLKFLYILKLFYISHQPTPESTAYMNLFLLSVLLFLLVFSCVPFL